MAQLAVRNIRKSFDRTEVLRGVDLEIAHGEFISLLGPSGCGKSTLLRIIAGLERQSDGAVVIEARDVSGVKPNRATSPWCSSPTRSIPTCRSSTTSPCLCVCGG